jgi:hypothetical protein
MDAEARIAELCRVLGATVDDYAPRDHVAQLVLAARYAVAEWLKTPRARRTRGAVGRGA